MEAMNSMHMTKTRTSYPLVCGNDVGMGRFYI